MWKKDKQEGEKLLTEQEKNPEMKINDKIAAIEKRLERGEIDKGTKLHDSNPRRNWKRNGQC